HIQDEDLRLLRRVVKTHLNLEMAATDEMIELAMEVMPNTATLVPERADEVTTEGGLDVVAHEKELSRAVDRLTSGGMLVSAFVDPLLAQVEASHHVGAHQIEICTSRYAELTDPALGAESGQVEEEVKRIAQCA